MATSDEAAQDHKSAIVQAPENANSPAYSDLSSSSSNSSNESDANELHAAAAAEQTAGDENNEKNDPDSATAEQFIPSQRELNGIVTLTTTNHSVRSPLSSDPEDDMQDMHGDENEVQAGIEDYAPEERMHSMSDPDSQITAVLQSSCSMLWKQFDALGTEMIVTRRGRRMFPPLKVELFDLDPNTTYTLYMDMVPVDKYRYKYQNSAWVRCFEEECSPTRLYMHPDSPALGSHWMNMVINFYKLKLTNNQLDKQGHIIVNSMHKYQPRLHVVESTRIGEMNQGQQGQHHMFIFPGTQFMTVTAYQNDKITQLKIENNPFAKGFRPPFSRCRGRNNQPGRIALPSTGSESSEDGLVIRNHRNMVATATVYDPQIYVVNRKRPRDPNSEIPPSPKQLCLPTAPSPKEQSPVNLCAPKVISQLPHNGHGHLVTFPVLPASSSINGGTVGLVQASNSPATFIQGSIIPTGSGAHPVGIIQAATSRSHVNGQYIPLTMNSSGHAPVNVIQALRPRAGQVVQVIPQHSLPNGMVISNAAINLEQNKSLPPTITTATAVSSHCIKRVSPSPPSSATTSEKGFQIRNSLSSTSSPPPLVQIKAEADVVNHHKSCSLSPSLRPQMMTVSVPPTTHQRTSFESTAVPVPVQNILIPSSSLQQPVILIATDATGGIDTNGAAAGAFTAVPVIDKSIVKARQLTQNSFNHSLVSPIQFLKVPSNTITTA